MNNYGNNRNKTIIYNNEILDVSFILCNLSPSKTDI